MAPPAAAYAHGVLVEKPERWVYTAGVVPIAPDGSIPTDIGDQAETVWGNIGLILAEAGMTPNDIVNVTTYVVAGRVAAGGDGGTRPCARRPPRREHADPGRRRSPVRSGRWRSRWSRPR